ncbi:hypothetical protein OPV22_010493 [Ensete ventricosum]|uniref:Uncharacterized protein n=1 Tax=Ensete ventricosum TaxID=4639 RepID=A0AAV8RHI9_ENSVE|nr:hypothetical protein OPV22_010493 [Ensete ventricosum]
MAFSAALRRAASAAAPVAIHPLPLARPPRQPLYGDPYPVSEDNDRRENSFPLSFLRVLLFGGKEGSYRRRPPPCHRVGDQVNREVLRLRYIRGNSLQVSVRDLARMRRERTLKSWFLCPALSPKRTPDYIYIPPDDYDDGKQSRLPLTVNISKGNGPRPDFNDLDNNLQKAFQDRRYLWWLKTLKLFFQN